ncbi:hypothetical protein F4859DRAFT_485733 [Xylaria cf. heliscus]|nr:hypothetical protein F4859DRAFT_485733 [Xylaria cf. heliscus]
MLFPFCASLAARSCFSYTVNIYTTYTTYTSNFAPEPPTAPVFSSVSTSSAHHFCSVADLLKITSPNHDLPRMSNRIHVLAFLGQGHHSDTSR